jgi:hypothetical protein
MRDIAEDAGHKDERIISDGISDINMPDIMTRLAISHHMAHYLRHPDSPVIEKWARDAVMALLDRVAPDSEGLDALQDDLKNIFKRIFRLKITPYDINKFDEYKENTIKVAQFA